MTDLASSGVVERLEQIVADLAVLADRGDVVAQTWVAHFGRDLHALRLMVQTRPELNPSQEVSR